MYIDNKETSLIYTFRIFCVFSAFICVVLNDFLGSAEITTPVKFSHIGCLLILCSIDYTKIRWSTIFIIVTLPLALIFGKWVSLWFFFAFSSQFYLYRKKFNIEQLAYLALFIMIFLLFWQFYRIESGDAKMLWMEKTTKTGGVAYDLGFGNPNLLGFYIFQISSLLIIKANYSFFIDLCKVCVLLIVGYFTFKLTASRTAAFSIFILCFFNLWYHLFGFGKKLRVLMGLFPLIFIVVMILILLFIPGLWGVVNEILSNRLLIMADYLRNLSVINIMVGNPMLDKGPIDNSLLYMLLTAGLAYPVMFMVCYYKIFVKYFHQIERFLPFLASLGFSIIGENTIGRLSGVTLIFWFLLLKPYLSRFTHKWHSYGRKHENRLYSAGNL